jgi:hypothetical protein
LPFQVFHVFGTNYGANYKLILTCTIAEHYFTTEFHWFTDVSVLELQEIRCNNPLKSFKGLVTGGLVQELGTI